MTLLLLDVFGRGEGQAARVTHRPGSHYTPKMASDVNCASM
jgi:hypothetical protein